MEPLTRACSSCAVPPARCIPLALWAPRGDIAVTLVCPSPLLLPWRGKMGVLAEGRANLKGLYLSGEILSGCSCPFSSRSPSVVSAPAAASGLVLWLGFGARLELGAPVLVQETFPTGSCSVLAIAASRVSPGLVSSFSCSACPAAEGDSVPGPGVLDISVHLRLGSGAVWGVLLLGVPFSPHFWMFLSLPRLFPALPRFTLGMVPMWVYMFDDWA